PSLQVFTLGDDRTAPFRLNIFEPPRGVKVQTHLENLEAAWNASFVMYSPLPYVVRQVLVETYKACGWDVSKDKRGRPITLDDLETKGRSKQLRHLTLVEEAHRLLPNVSTQKGDPESAGPRRRMVEQFANMLAEVRAYGEGLAIVEQIPTKIIPDAIKNTATKIAHRVPAADDRDVLAGAMNVTEEQSPAFAALQPGEAIISVERHPIPIKILVPNTIDKIGLPIGEIGGDEVKRHMTEF